MTTYLKNIIIDILLAYYVKKHIGYLENVIRPLPRWSLSLSLRNSVKFIAIVESYIILS